jgi:hypothetical protein
MVGTWTKMDRKDRIPSFVAFTLWSMPPATSKFLVTVIDVTSFVNISLSVSPLLGHAELTVTLMIHLSRRASRGRGRGKGGNVCALAIGAREADK